MATRNINFSPGEFYHVYNRGTEKRDIFKDTADYRRFVELLYLSNSTKSINVREVKKSHQDVFKFERDNTLVSIGAYCLMPNHFHILVTPRSEQGLGTFMNKLGTSYSMYFNRRYERSGSLFEGTYKAKHANTDRYVKYLFAYIHLNPIKLLQSDWKEQGILNKNAAYNYVSTFQYSSLPDHLGGSRIERAILAREAFPAYFKEQVDVREDLFEWLSFADETPSPG